MKDLRLMMEHTYLTWIPLNMLRQPREVCKRMKFSTKKRSPQGNPCGRVVRHTTGQGQ